MMPGANRRPEAIRDHQRIDPLGDLAHRNDRHDLPILYVDRRHRSQRGVGHVDSLAVRRERNPVRRRRDRSVVRQSQARQRDLADQFQLIERINKDRVVGNTCDP